VILYNFDHKFLNLDTPYFKDRIPTTENIGLVLFDQINRAFAGDKKFRVKKIRLYERHDLYVDIWGKDK
jgi:6-pyruvoyltetrahydropterin/6-carboxytetrahydropterin synthase